MSHGRVEFETSDTLGRSSVLSGDEEPAIEIQAIDPVDRKFWDTLIEPNDFPACEVEKADAASIIGHEHLPAIGMHGRRLGRDEFSGINSFQSVSTDAIYASALPVTHDRASLAG